MLLKLGKVLNGMQKRKEEERGFTLIELLVVVIIIGILAAIAIPTFLSQRARAQDANATSAARNYATASQTWLTSQPVGTDYSATGYTVANLQAQDSALPANVGAGDITVAYNADPDFFTVTVPSASGNTVIYDSSDSSVVVDEP